MRTSQPSAFRRRANPVAVAVAVSVIWLAGTGALLAILGSDGAQWLAIAVAVALPLLMIWFAALLARQSAQLRDEAARLAEAADRVREAAAAAQERLEVPQRETHRPQAPRPEPPPAARPAPVQPEPPPMRLTQAPERASTPLPEAPGARSEPPQRQEALPLGMAPEETPVRISVLARALDFPADPEDKEGFRALHRALRDPRTRRLVQASQDVLTLLSEEGIYMDDLPPARARPEIWRRFAGGERGAEVGAIGGIRDRSSLALTAARFRSDPVFRDVAHHFLRLFDTSLTEIADRATDAELAALADTRTARAFMLVGRVAGIFE